MQWDTLRYFTTGSRKSLPLSSMWHIPESTIDTQLSQGDLWPESTAVVLPKRIVVQHISAHTQICQLRNSPNVFHPSDSDAGWNSTQHQTWWSTEIGESWHASYQLKIDFSGFQSLITSSIATLLQYVRYEVVVCFRKWEQSSIFPRDAGWKSTGDAGWNKF